jgi:NADPH:quinone reductase-like Zn-dependent oxidoreductase
MAPGDLDSVPIGVTFSPTKTPSTEFPLRAAVFERFGPPAEVLQVKDIAPGEPHHGEVLVRMLASPINPSDLMTVRGVYGTLPSLPAVPGFEGVGVVERSGGGAFGRLLVGRRVAVLNGRTGNWCERTVIPARQAIPLPKDLPLDQAAMFFVNPATAWLLTRKVLAVPRGQWLLQTAAASAVGKMVIRLGLREGFRTLNVVRREDQLDELRGAGATECIVFDTERDPPERLRDEVARLAGEGSVRCAIDPVAGPTAAAVAECLGERGRLVIYGTLSDKPIPLAPRPLLTKGATLEGFWLARWMLAAGLTARLRLVRALVRLIRQGTLRSDVAAGFPLERIREAVAAADAPGRGGKILLRIADDAG